ncbi:MAG: hypothetical protein AB7O04_06255 [Hyphomonadaceae bacterium]
MKTLPDEAIEMLEGRRPIIAGAARFLFSEAYRFWSGYGDIEIDGETFTGIGAQAMITPVNSEMGGAADGLSIVLSALDPDVAQSVETEDYHQKPVTIWRLIFAPDARTLLGAAVFMRGRVDVINIHETVGGEASLEFAIEGPRRDMSRAGARIRSDSDQRILGGTTDGAFQHISVAGRKTLYWGQRPATASGALGGGRRGGISFPQDVTVPWGGFF